MKREEILLKIGERIASLSHNASQICEEYEGYRLACADVSDILDEFAKEIDVHSVPGLDEAAEEYKCNAMRRAESETYDHPLPAFHDGYMAGVSAETVGAFKAGAKWLAGQGVTKEAVIGMATEEISINVSQKALDALDVRPCDKVIVQIRKK